MENEYLCFVKYVGKDVDEMNIYEFLFTDNLDEFWGENFEYMPCCLCNSITPNQDSYNIVKKLKTNLKLTLITESCCNSMQDCLDGIIALAWEDISNYEEYPENGRLVLHFGIDYDEVEKMLAERNILFEKEKE